MQRRPELLNVPLSDTGLRMYAANGDWSLVANYAVKLEEAAADAVHDTITLIHGRVASYDEIKVLSSPVNKYKSKEDERSIIDNNHVNIIRVSSELASLASRLPYILVQVTAYFKMQRIAAAKALLDRLGDVESERFYLPLEQINNNNNSNSMIKSNSSRAQDHLQNSIIITTPTMMVKSYGESIVPFSLRFIAALIPFYVGVIMESEKRLDHLLAVCERHLRKENERENITIQTSKPKAMERSNEGNTNEETNTNNNNNNYGYYKTAKWERLTWLRRKQRILRALIYVYFVQKEYEVTILTFTKLIKTFEQEMECFDELATSLTISATTTTTTTTTNTITTRESGSMKKNELTHSILFRRVMLLQEFGCVCLHCGNVSTAQEAFHEIELLLTNHEKLEEYNNINEDIKISTTKEESVLYNCIMTLNNVYVLMFNGAFDVAVDVLQTLIHECARTSQHMKNARTTQLEKRANVSSSNNNTINLETADKSNHNAETLKLEQKQESKEQAELNKEDKNDKNDFHASSKPEKENCISYDSLTENTLRLIWTNAMNTHITALPYDVRIQVNPMQMMSTIIGVMEQYMQSNPLMFAHNDAFLTNAVRLYTLHGDRTGKLEQLAILLEQYRCEAASVPSLDKMI